MFPGHTETTLAGPHLDDTNSQAVNYKLWDQQEESHQWQKCCNDCVIDAVSIITDFWPVRPTIHCAQLCLLLKFCHGICVIIQYHLQFDANCCCHTMDIFCLLVWCDARVCGNCRSAWCDGICVGNTQHVDCPETDNILNYAHRCHSNGDGGWSVHYTDAAVSQDQVITLTMVTMVMVTISYLTVLTNWKFWRLFGTVKMKLQKLIVYE